MRSIAVILTALLALFPLTACGMWGEIVPDGRKQGEPELVASEAGKDEDSSEISASDASVMESEPESETDSVPPEEITDAASDEDAPDVLENPVPFAETLPEPVDESTAPSVGEFHVDSIVQEIRQWYQDIVLDTTLVRHDFTTAATVYTRDGEIVTITEYHQLNDDMNTAMETIHFYYRDGEPFFVLVKGENIGFGELRLYFHEGKLIRWIMDNNLPVDLTENAAYQGYYDDAVTAFKNAQQALG